MDVWDLFTFIYRVHLAGAAAHVMFLGRTLTGGPRLAE